MVDGHGLGEAADQHFCHTQERQGLDAVLGGKPSVVVGVEQPMFALLVIPVRTTAASRGLRAGRANRRAEAQIGRPYGRFDME